LTEKVKFGFCLPIFSSAGDTHVRTPCLEKVDYDLVKKAALRCEDLGYDSIWAADHLILGKNGAILECWTTLSALAGITSKIRLGTIHLCNLFRHPSLIAKMAATLDFISNGRLEFFIDAGWNMAEVNSYGLPWNENSATRIERLREAIEIIKRMWIEEKPSFKGKFYELRDAVCEPKPVQKSHPPLWIGTFSVGGGAYSSLADDLMMRVIADHADVWNNTPASVETCREKLERLRKHCVDAGRDFRSLLKSLETEVMIAKNEKEIETVLRRIRTLNPAMRFYSDLEECKKVYIIGTPDECVGRIKEYMDLGITRFLVWFIDFPSFRGIELFAKEVIPQFQ